MMSEGERCMQWWVSSRLARRIVFIKLVSPKHRSNRQRRGRGSVRHPALVPRADSRLYHMAFGVFLLEPSFTAEQLACLRRKQQRGRPIMFVRTCHGLCNQLRAALSYLHVAHGKGRHCLCSGACQQRAPRSSATYSNLYTGCTSSILLPNCYRICGTSNR